METHAHRSGIQVPAADDEHGMDAQLFRVLNLCLDRVAAEVGAHADLICREPKWEFARVMLDEKADELFVPPVSKPTMITSVSLGFATRPHGPMRR